MTDSTTQRPPGLRERKKLKAMRHIQEVALDLFDQHGYGNVTIERIAAEAEVSPSSVYRYFGTKEMIVLWDEYDPIALRAFDDMLAVQDPITALRAALSDVVMVALLEGDERLIRRRISYAMTEPDIRAGINRQADEMIIQIRQTMAKHTGRDPDGLELRVITASLVAAFMAAVVYWHESGYRESVREVVDGALEVIGRGLRVE